jgi:hypothetical protein
MNTRHETTDQMMTRLEREMHQMRANAAKRAATSQPLLAAEEDRRAALAREAAEAEQLAREENDRIARIAAELDAAKRQAEGERLSAIREAVEAQPEVATLAERAEAEAEEYGMRRPGQESAGDARALDIAKEASRLFWQITGIGGTAPLWFVHMPQEGAEMSLFGLRWFARFTPQEPGSLFIEVPGTGNRLVPNMSELHLLIGMYPSVFAGLVNAGKVA